MRALAYGLLYGAAFNMGLAAWKDMAGHSPGDLVPSLHVFTMAMISFALLLFTIADTTKPAKPKPDGP